MIQTSWVDSLDLRIVHPNQFIPIDSFSGNLNNAIIFDKWNLMILIDQSRSKIFDQNEFFEDTAKSNQ